MDRIKINLADWENAACPICTKNVNLEKAERDLYLVMTMIHGYSDTEIENLLDTPTDDKFNTTLCTEEETSVIDNGGVYYEDMSDCLMKIVNMKIIVGLPLIDGIDHNTMSDKEKYEYAMTRENHECQVFHSTQTFLDMLNANQVDTENLLFYEIVI